MCILLLGTTGVTAAHAQQTSGFYFLETRHNVLDAFWTYYQSVDNANLLFGYPITDQFENSQGITVQYFQRARFEYYPARPLGQQVQISALGSLLYTPGAPSLDVSTPGACRSFATGYSVCYDFLTFFDQYGGLARFGNPISAFEFQPDGRIVQHFERARLEWHPEYPRGQNVTLAELGTLAFEYLNEDPTLRDPDQPHPDLNVRQQSITSLRVMAFVWKAVTLPSDSQKIYVIVQDQTRTPVSNAEVIVTVNLTNGSPQTFRAFTDANGIALVDNVIFTEQPYGSLVVIDVAVSAGGHSAHTTTSFRIWR